MILTFVKKRDKTQIIFTKIKVNKLANQLRRDAVLFKNFIVVQKRYLVLQILSVITTKF